MYFSNSFSINELRKNAGPRSITPWQSTSYRGCFDLTCFCVLLEFCVLVRVCGLVRFCGFVRLTQQKNPHPFGYGPVALAHLVPAFIKVSSKGRGDFFRASPEVIRHGPVLGPTIWQLCHRSEVFTSAVIKWEFFDFVFHDLSIVALAPKGKFYFTFL